MTLAPELEPFLEAVAAATPPDAPRPGEPGAPSVEQVRQMFDASSTIFASSPVEVGAVEDRTIPGPGGDLAIRVYAPRGRGPFPVLVYLHGGGFVIGSVETHDPVCRRITRAAGCVTVSVDYRLAPEHPYPAPLDDCHAAVRWVSEHATEIGGDPLRLALGGDSAGGNLAATVALRLRDEHGPSLAAQVLVYPVIDVACDTPSFTENGEGYFLTADSMRWFWSLYLPDPAVGTDPYVSPDRATDLSGLPPALVITAELDPLRDEGEAYAEALRAAGVPATVRRFDGMIHGFAAMYDVTPAAAEASELIASTLRDAFGT